MSVRKAEKLNQWQLWSKVVEGDVLAINTDSFNSFYPELKIEELRQIVYGNSSQTVNLQVSYRGFKKNEEQYCSINDSCRFLSGLKCRGPVNLIPYADYIPKTIKSLWYALGVNLCLINNQNILGKPSEFNLIHSIHNRFGHHLYVYDKEEYITKKSFYAITGISDTFFTLDD